MLLIEFSARLLYIKVPGIGTETDIDQWNQIEDSDIVLIPMDI